MSSRHHGTSHRERDPRGGSSGDASRKRPALNEYWIDGEGIHREVLQGEICRFLGSDATCRPGDYNVRFAVLASIQVTNHISGQGRLQDQGHASFHNCEYPQPGCWRCTN